MSQDPAARGAADAGEATARGPAPGISPALNALADHWGLVLGYGVVTLALGLILAVWPSETLKVCAVLLGIQFLVSGVFRIVLALMSSGLDGAVRALAGLTGALAVIVGLLCLRNPTQTLLVIGLLIGVWLLISGFVDVITAVLSPVRGRRGWDIATGVLGVLVGGFLVVNPHVSLGLLVVMTCIWLFGVGLLAVVVGLRLRSELARSDDGSLGGTAGPAASPAG